MSNNRIEVGDIVDVCFLGDQGLSGMEVLDMPVATGDCWDLKRVRDGKIFYVQTFEYISLMKKKNWRIE